MLRCKGESEGVSWGVDLCEGAGTRQRVTAAIATGQPYPHVTGEMRDRAKKPRSHHAERAGMVGSDDGDG